MLYAGVYFLFLKTTLLDNKVLNVKFCRENANRSLFF